MRRKNSADEISDALICKQINDQAPEKVRGFFFRAPSDYYKIAEGKLETVLPLYLKHSLKKWNENRAAERRNLVRAGTNCIKRKFHIHASSCGLCYCFPFNTFSSINSII